MLQKKYIDKEIKIDYSFQKFWKMYPKKVGKRASEIKFKYVKDLKNCFEWLDKYIEKWEKEETPRMFIPDPRTFLNQERYYDEIIIDEKKSWIYKKNVEKKEEEKKEKIEEKKAQIQRSELIFIYNNLSKEERIKIKNKAVDEVKKIAPNIYNRWWAMYDQILKISIRKILNDKYKKYE